MATKLIQSWKEGGRQKVLAALLDCSSADEISASKDVEQEKDIKYWVYQLISAVVNGNLQVKLLAEMFLDTQIQAIPHVQLIIADMMQTISQDIDHGPQKNAANKRTNLRELIQKCSENRSVHPRLLCERISTATLHSAGVLSMDVRDFDKTKNRMRTTMFYKQQKYNLLREESEGYAKLVTELNADLSDDSPDALMMKIQSLIGHFALDPNRVLEHILTAFEGSNPLENKGACELFVNILKQYKTGPTSLSDLLGFRFQAFHKTEEKEEGKAKPKADEKEKSRRPSSTTPAKKTDDTPVAPSSLYNLTAVLIKHGLVTLEQIFPHLSPSADGVKKLWAEAITEAKGRTIKRQSAEEAIKSKIGLTRESTKAGKSNQKLGVCLALLRVENWDAANQIIAQFPSFFTTAWPPLRKQLCSMVQTVIEPVYRECAPKTSKAPTKDVISDLALCHKLPELVDTVFPMLKRLGMFVSSDVMLMIKVIRVCKQVMVSKDLEESTKENLKQEILSIFERVLLPGISLIEPGNPALVEEAWTVLKLFPYEQRYRLYAFWKNSAPRMHPDVLLAQKQAQKNTSYVLKRISKENVKKLGRVLGKISHSNPGTMFDEVLDKIQAYDNMIEPIVDSLKYLTNLAKDTLAFCVIECISNPEKTRMKEGDINLGGWLQSLANFCGHMFKKFAIELKGTLQYIANKLKTHESYDLLVLQEIIKKMTGMERLEDVTDDQLRALTGGEALAQEASFMSSKVSKDQRRATVRLRNTLLEKDKSGEDLAIPLLILIAQQLNLIIFGKKQETMHLKLLTSVYDQIQETLVQFSAFLNRHVKVEDYVSRLPTLEDLCNKYHLEPRTAFHIARPQFHFIVQEAFKAGGDDSHSAYVTARSKAMAPIYDNVQKLFPASFWNEKLTTKLFTVFWTLSMYDLDTPKSIYKNTIMKLKQDILRAEKDTTLSRSKLKKEKERCETLIAKLAAEEKAQTKNQMHITAWLEAEKDTWIPKEIHQAMLVTQFLQRCSFPRCLVTAADAIFCAKFASVLHSMKTAHWATVLYYDRLLGDVTCTVTSCTPDEARRYGRFLSETLKLLWHWHSSEEVYARCCTGHPGFYAFYITGNRKELQGKTTETIKYEDYRHMCHKWHRNMTKAMCHLLESQNYTMIRNILLVLNALLPIYPRILGHMKAIDVRVSKVLDGEKKKGEEGMQDLMLMCNMYAAKLNQHKATGVCVPEGEFHIKEVVEKKEVKKEESASKDTKKETKADVKKESKKGDEMDVDVKPKQSKSSSQTKSTKSTKPSGSGKVIERITSEGRDRGGSRERTPNTKDGRERTPKDGRERTPKDNRERTPKDNRERDRETPKDSRERTPKEREGSSHRESRERSSTREMSREISRDVSRESSREASRELSRGPSSGAGKKRARNEEPLSGEKDKDAKKRARIEEREKAGNSRKVVEDLGERRPKAKARRK
eukprot:m.94541 g.94541  ORF g.94541 m.94541 type:complete len:1452 (+) comp13451_c0_seq1:1253-5608(+)